MVQVARLEFKCMLSCLRWGQMTQRLACVSCYTLDTVLLIGMSCDDECGFSQACTDEQLAQAATLGRSIAVP